MTDEHGSDTPETGHEDVPAEGHSSQEAEPGVWSDDHPPVDDFADPSSTNEEGATASHEVATETEEETSATPTAAPARSMLPLFAGIGGVLLIGAVIYWQFGHSSSSPPPMVAAASAPKSPSSVGKATNSGATSAPTSTTTGDMDIASLYKPAPEPAAPAIPEPSPVSAAPPTPAPDTVSQAPTIVPPVPSSSGSNVASNIIPSNTSAPSTQIVPPTAVTMDTRIDNLSARIDGIQKSLDDATRQLNQLNNMVAANQAMPPAAGPTNVALEDRLNKIEQNVMQIEHKEATKTPSVTSPPTEAIETSATTSVKSTTHHKKASAAHKSMHKKAKVYKPQPMPASPIGMSNSSGSAPWVLRAATPTEAWVASNASTNELQHIQVGDSLVGIGQVHAIRRTASGWEVEGTTGSVR